MEKYDRARWSELTLPLMGCDKHRDVPPESSLRREGWISTAKVGWKNHSIHRHTLSPGGPSSNDLLPRCWAILKGLCSYTTPCGGGRALCWDCITVQLLSVPNPFSVLPVPTGDLKNTSWWNSFLLVPLSEPASWRIRPPISNKPTSCAFGYTALRRAHISYVYSWPKCKNCI